MVADRTRSATDIFNVRFNLNKAIMQAPAGPVGFNLVFGHQSSQTEIRRSLDYAPAAIRQTAQDAQISLSIPIADGNSATLGPLGAVSANLAGGITSGTGVPLRTRLNYGLTWNPATWFQFSGSLAEERLSPTVEQLSAPEIVLPNIRYFDLVQGELVEIEQVVGGNPNLQRGKVSTMTLNSHLNLTRDGALSLTAIYTEMKRTNDVGALPILSPQVEAAFPGRATRDANGRLIRIDSRPINVSSSESANLRLALNFFKMLLPPQIPPDGDPDGVPVLVNEAPPGLVQLSLGHNWQLRDRILLGPGLAELDRLSGFGAAGTGNAAHSLFLQSSLTLRGIGTNLMARWTGPRRVRSEAANDPSSDLRLGALAKFDLKLFANLDQQKWLFGEASWTSKMRLSVEVTNLFDARQRVVNGDGVVPIGFTRDESDPLGRTVKVSLRKLI